MNILDDSQIRTLLKNAIATPADEELRHDLWPTLRLKMERRSSMIIPWYDWVLAALVVLFCMLVPETIGGLLLHL